MRTEQDPETSKTYPVSFLIGIAEDLLQEIIHCLRAYDLPIKEAIDAAVYLHVLIGYDPATFQPDGLAGWEREVSEAIKQAAILRETVTALRVERVTGVSSEEYNRLSEARRG